MRIRPRFHWLALLLAYPGILAAQPAADSGKKNEPHKPTRLFRSREPITMWLTADFKAVNKDTDTLSTKKYPAKMRYLGEKGDTVSLDVELGTRGHFRLRTCKFVPLKVYFNEEQTKNGPFAGEKSLKLGTHCSNEDRMVQNTYIEYAINRMYNILTPLSLKARLANVTYIDPANPKFTVTQPGIWYQDDEDLAKEFRGKIVMQQGGSTSAMEPHQQAITDLFQYMIGNTDMGMTVLHNYRIVTMDTSSAWFAFAYDFDWAGLVDAPYAAPDQKLQDRYGIHYVTERLFRGISCYPEDIVAGTINLFRARKDSLYAALSTLNGLKPERAKKATDYLDGFYKKLDDPKQVKKVLEFNDPCKP